VQQSNDSNDSTITITMCGPRRGYDKCSSTGVEHEWTRPTSKRWVVQYLETNRVTEEKEDRIKALTLLLQTSNILPS